MCNFLWLRKPSIRVRNVCGQSMIWCSAGLIWDIGAVCGNIETPQWEGDEKRLLGSW